MRLRKLAIHALPGIEPGFTFEPPDAGINVVTGPNAIGKSSLARALEYLLATRGSDPPALFLEAEFDSGDARWQVSRNGNRIVWCRNGEVVSRPALPGADRIGLFRLSVENLLDDNDADDKALAERLWRELHGNFDLSEPRIEITRRFARHEAGKLAEAVKGRRRVESEYADLQRQEAELPDLARRIERAEAAEARCEHLRQALRLADAIDARKAREAALQRFPPNMDRLRGDEIEQLEERESKTRELREELRDRRRDLEAAVADRDRTGLAQSTPAPEDMRATEERLRWLDGKSIERNNAEVARAEAGAALHDALAHFNRDGDPPRLDAGACRRAEDVTGPLIAAQVRRRELGEQLDLVGESPDAAEMERQRNGVEALRAWLAGHAAEPGRTRAAPSKLLWIVSWVALAGAALATLAAFVQGALVAAAGALAALVAFGLGLFLQRARQPAAPPPTDEAERRFRETGLVPPPQWSEQAVRKHLSDVVEARLNELTLQQARAAGTERIALQLRETDAEIEKLEEQRAALADEIGLDPRLPAADLQRFVQLCSEWDKARTRHVEQRARLDLLDREIAEAARLVGDFLGRWRATDDAAADDSAGDSAGGSTDDSTGGSTDDSASDSTDDSADDFPGGSARRPDPIHLRAAFDDLERRNEAATEACHRVRGCEADIRSLEQRIAEIDEAVESLFAQAGVEFRERATLVGRIERLPQWKEASDALRTANAEEALVRARLAEQPGLVALDLVALADGGERARLQADHKMSAGAAGEYDSLQRQRTKIETRLADAGKDRKLERAAAEEDRAKQALEDKRDEALLAAATDTLLDDVEQAFVAEHEPVVLRRARKVFAEVTAGAFDLRLRGDGAFIAHDVRQGAARALSQLSSGTRMQLLLALRVAWIETREQGGEAWPLFLDEALTTSDEARFAVMAQSLERLAASGSGEGDETRGRPGDGAGVGDGDGDGDEADIRAAGRSEDGTGAEDGAGGGVGDGDGAEVRAAGRTGDGAGSRRQIFYLSARRHEPALWQQATGARPAVVDLAAVRFPSEASAPEDYRVEAPPSLPAPNGRNAETYASLLGVPPRLDPYRPVGGIHLFHLLRDDLTLLHTLMDAWRIGSLGQLEVLLASDAAQAVLPSEDLRRRLRQRGRVVWTWIELWRQGRGKPVDRGVLEQCPAVSAIFIDRVVDLAAQVQGDGAALVQALRDGEMDRFRSRKIDELEQWLADEGYTDDRDRLNDEERRRLTLQRVAPVTAAEAADVNRVVSWLEAAGEGPGDPGNASGDGSS